MNEQLPPLPDPSHQPSKSSMPGLDMNLPDEKSSRIMPDLSPHPGEIPYSRIPKPPESFAQKTKRVLKTSLLCLALFTGLLLSWIFYPEWFQGIGWYEGRSAIDSKFGNTPVEREVAGELQEILEEVAQAQLKSTNPGEGPQGSRHLDLTSLQRERGWSPELSLWDFLFVRVPESAAQSMLAAQLPEKTEIRSIKIVGIEGASIGKSVTYQVEVVVNDAWFKVPTSALLSAVPDLAPLADIVNKRSFFEELPTGHVYLFRKAQPLVQAGGVVEFYWTIGRVQRGDKSWDLSLPEPSLFARRIDFDRGAPAASFRLRSQMEIEYSSGLQETKLKSLYAEVERIQQSRMRRLAEIERRKQQEKQAEQNAVINGGLNILNSVLRQILR
ncbi:MAG: hypothetical protein HC904_16205 [Blastochloris sp.]|nr:hypothetical protein [Blastochloris sp.]